MELYTAASHSLTATLEINSSSSSSWWHENFWLLWSWVIDHKPLARDLSHLMTGKLIFIHISYSDFLIHLWLPVTMRKPSILLRRETVNTHRQPLQTPSWLLLRPGSWFIQTLNPLKSQSIFYVHTIAIQLNTRATLRLIVPWWTIILELCYFICHMPWAQWRFHLIKLHQNWHFQSNKPSGTTKERPCASLASISQLGRSRVNPSTAEDFGKTLW